MAPANPVFRYPNISVPSQRIIGVRGIQRLASTQVLGGFNLFVVAGVVFQPVYVDCAEELDQLKLRLLPSTLIDYQQPDHRNTA